MPSRGHEHLARVNAVREAAQRAQRRQAEEVERKRAELERRNQQRAEAKVCVGVHGGAMLLLLHTLCGTNQMP
jgi:hypothetical protein